MLTLTLIYADLEPIMWGLILNLIRLTSLPVDDPADVEILQGTDHVPQYVGYGSLRETRLKVSMQNISGRPWRTNKISTYQLISKGLLIIRYMLLHLKKNRKYWCSQYRFGINPISWFRIKLNLFFFLLFFRSSCFIFLNISFQISLVLKVSFKILKRNTM